MLRFAFNVKEKVYCIEYALQYSMKLDVNIPVYFKGPSLLYLGA